MKRLIRGIILFELVLVLMSVPSLSDAGILNLAAKGYVEASFYPPHNEYDPNSGVTETALSFDKRTVARYALDVNLEIWSKDLPWLFFFTKDKAYFGDSQPRYDYNYRADPIVADAEYGVGIRLPGVEFRGTHAQSVSLGNRFIAEPRLWNSFSVRVPFEFK